MSEPKRLSELMSGNSSIAALALDIAQSTEEQSDKRAKEVDERFERVDEVAKRFAGRLRLLDEGLEALQDADETRIEADSQVKRHKDRINELAVLTLEQEKQIDGWKSARDRADSLWRAQKKHNEWLSGQLRQMKEAHKLNVATIRKRDESARILEAELIDCNSELKNAHNGNVEAIRKRDERIKALMQALEIKGWGSEKEESDGQESKEGPGC